MGKLKNEVKTSTKEFENAIKNRKDEKDMFEKDTGPELEAYKSSLKAIKMKESSEQSLGAQEREAYASQDYQDLCKAIGAATYKTEMWKYRLEAAKLRFEAWRTREASNRTLERLTR